MLSGAHIIINSTNPDADHAFVCDVLQLPYADVGDDWDDAFSAAPTSPPSRWSVGVARRFSTPRRSLRSPENH
jgi:hypothetical protein